MTPPPARALAAQATSWSSDRTWRLLGAGRRARAGGAESSSRVVVTGPPPLLGYLLEARGSPGDTHSGQWFCPLRFDRFVRLSPIELANRQVRKNACLRLVDTDMFFLNGQAVEAPAPASGRGEQSSSRSTMAATSGCSGGVCTACWQALTS